eukprot:1816432-Pyramimonas_sp.AAC.1
MAQRAQISPTVADLIEAARIAAQAKRYNETTIAIPKLDGELCVLVFHDAAWANMDEPGDKAFGTAWWRRRRCKTAFASDAPKKLITQSQAGFLAFVTEKKILEDGEGKAALVDWRSATIIRVCRSTLAVETMRAVGAVGAAM